MKTIILYYSYSGKTKMLAAKKALEMGVDIEEISEKKKPSFLKAFAAGTFKARKRKKAEVQPIKAALSGYDQIIIMAPVWAGYPAPAFNNIIELLPAGKKVELFLTSASGGAKGSVEGSKALVTARGCEVTGYTDIKT